jgi:hypothetical protein
MEWRYYGVIPKKILTYHKNKEGQVFPPGHILSLGKKLLHKICLFKLL